MPKSFVINDESDSVPGQHVMAYRSRQRIWNYLVKFLSIITLMGTVMLSCEQKPYGQGENLYQAYCASCHMDEGQGLKSLIPPLAQADYLELNREKLACIIRYGLDDPIIVNGQRFEQPMAGIDQLNAVEITNILNFIGSSWGNKLEPFALKEVEAVLENCAKE